MPFISFIVPVYNLSKGEVSKCIDSMLNQTDPDNEIIIVDDGSTNGIEFFCDELSKKFNIKVIHQNNQGLAYARNTGISAAKGDWIVHVDGDDWVGCNLVERLKKECRSTQADIVVWGYTIFNRNSTQELLLRNKTIFDRQYESVKEDALCAILGDSNKFSFICLNTSWAKAYRRGFIIDNNLHYDIKLRRAQDVAYNLYAFDKAQNVYYIDRALNIYRNDNESLSRGYNPKNIDYIIATVTAVKQFVDKHSDSPKIYKAYNLFVQRCFRMINEQTIQNKKNNQSFIEKKRVFKTIINQEPFHSAYLSGYKRSGIIWEVGDYLYKHQLFVSILVYNFLIRTLYKIKHFIG